MYQELNNLKSKFTNSQILNLFSNQEILQYLKRKGIQQFLLNIQSQQLRQGFKARKKKQMQDDERPSTYRKNVLDLPLKDILFECSQHQIITTFQYNSYINGRGRKKQFYLTDHGRLGKSLVQFYPDQFYVGQRSAQYNISNAITIQQQYGIFRNQQESNEKQVNQNNVDESLNQEMDNSQDLQKNKLKQFIVSDHQIEEEVEESESLQAQVIKKEYKIKKQRKKKRKLRRNYNNQVQSSQDLAKNYQIQQNTQIKRCLKRGRRTIDLDSQ